MPVKINGATSGSVTLAAPATGSDVTLTLPGSSGTLPVSSWMFVSTLCLALYLVQRGAAERENVILADEAAARNTVRLARDASPT